MTLAVLIDLDDTLLSSNQDQFLEQYFHELSSALSPYVKPERMMQAMSSAVRAMLAKKDPPGTMEDVFDQVFYPGIGIQKAELTEILDEFYQVRFPRLAPLTSQRPEAIQLIEKALNRGWQVIIATNPLFPATAIHQKLAWAGLPTATHPFAWITDYSTAHFCKPNPAYYAEILALFCWPESPVVMVGNDLEDDISPAEAIGMPTYWLCENPCREIPFQRHPASSQGPISSLETWLEHIEHENLLPILDSTIAIKSTLATTPAAITTFTKRVAESRWNQRPLKDEWSLTEIICHLRDVDRDVNMQRIQSILSDRNPFIPGADTDPWVQERDYASERGPDALNSFTEIRTEILHMLESTDMSDWGKSAQHAIFGPTTLQELVNFIATHDRMHIKQVWKTIQAVSANRQ